MAIGLYERHIYRYGMIASVVTTGLMIIILTEAESLWAYAGLATALAYTVATLMSMKRFKPDLNTINFNVMDKY